MATAPPTNQLDESLLFVEQVGVLVQTHLSDEGRYIFSHFTQMHGFLLLAIGIARLHESDKASFHKMVNIAWKEQEEHLTVKQDEEKK